MTPAQLHILHALGVVWARDGRATVRSVAIEARRGANATWKQLVKLRRMGLVMSGPLRPGEVS